MVVLLTEFDIVYMTKKTIKGRAIAEFLALTPRSRMNSLNLNFLMKDSTPLKFKDGYYTSTEQ